MFSGLEPIAAKRTAPIRPGCCGDLERRYVPVVTAGETANLLWR